MAPRPINSWQIDGETMETVTGFIFLGCKITTDDDCSHEIKRRLLLGSKAMTNLDSILKSRDITLMTKVCIVKAVVFLVVMYGSEIWTIKKAERQRMDDFELLCWRRLLRVSDWTELNWDVLEVDGGGGCTAVWMYLMSLNHTLKNSLNGDFPGGPVVNTSPSDAGGATGSLVGELRSHKPRSQKKQNRK